MWTAAVVSRFGDALRTAALPLLAVTLTSDPFLIALVTACGYVPWLLFGLLGGALADRVDQRRAMWAVDTVRAALVAAFAVAVGTGHASLPLLMALAFTLTTLGTLFDNAATALLPSLVPTGALGSANARVMTGQQIAGSFLAAPLVPALLAVSVAAPYGVDAASYVLAATLVASLRPAAPERAPRKPGSTLRAETAEGLRALWADRTLRGLCAATTVCNIGMGALIATLVLDITGWLGAGQSGYATTVTAYGAGSAVGGLLAKPLARRCGRIGSVLLAGAVQTGCLVAIGSVRELWVTVAAMALFGVLGMVWNVNLATLVQERAPEAMLGRVSAAFRTLSVAGAPLGAVLGGAAAASWGLNTPALLASGLFVAAVAALIPARAA
nr:MFS transporter [Streptomyces sp. SID1034]